MKTNSRHALLCASAALLMLAGAPANAETDVAGVTAAVNPKATAFDGAGKPRLISLGDPVIRNHRIETSGEGLVQILLADGTSFTVGPNSSVVIDSFVYDPDKNTASLAATMTKGALRFIGGKASKASGNVKIDTPIGTAGIRGAVVDINLNGQTSDGQPLPPHMTLVYGKEVELTGNGSPQRLFRQGFSIVAGDGQPRVQRTPPQWVSGLQQVLAGRPGTGGGASKVPTDQTVSKSPVSQTNSAQLPSANAIPVPTPRPIPTAPVENIAGDSQRDVGTRPEVPWDGSVGVVYEEPGYRSLYETFGQLTQQADGSWEGVDDDGETLSLEGIAKSNTLTSADVTGYSSILDSALNGTAYSGSGDFIAYLMRSNDNTPFYVVGGKAASMASTFTGTKVLHYVVQPDPATGAVSIGAVNPDLAAALAGTETVNSDLLVVAASGLDGDEKAIVGKAIQASLSISGDGVNQTSAINVTAGTFAQLSSGGNGLKALSSGSYLSSASAEVENTQSAVETIGGSEGRDELFGKNGEYMVIVASAETYVPDPSEGPGTINFDVGANILSRNDSLTQRNVASSFANQTVSGFAAGAVKTWSGIDLDTGMISLTFNGTTHSFTGEIDVNTTDGRDEIYLTSSNSETAYLTDRLIAATSDVDGSYIVSSDVVPVEIFANRTSSSICNACNFMTWGWWGKAANGESSQSVHLGNWIIGKTPEVGRLPASGSAIYNGNAVGTVLNDGDQYIATGTMRSTMNFGTRTGDVQITNYDGRDFTSNVNFGTGAATFSGSGTTNGVTSSVTGAFASNGTDQVKGIMGSFTAEDGTWSSTGIFAGSR
ncbi:MAG: FecR domain-containing protein [Allorhizobium sp.]